MTIDQLMHKFQPYGEEGDTVDRRIVYEVTHRRQEGDELISDSDTDSGAEEFKAQDKEDGISAQ